MGYYRGLVTAAVTGMALLGFSPPSPAATPIQIGFSMPLTGPFAVSGKQALIAMKLWEDDINAKGGLLHRPVKLVYYDDQSNPANVPGIYTKLLDVNKVDLLVSPYGTVMTAPALPVVMAHKMVITSLVALNVNSRFHYDRYFSVTASGADPVVDFSSGFFQAVMEQTPKPKTLAFIGADQEFSKQNLAGAMVNAKKAGLKIVYNETYPPSTTDFAPIIRAAQATHPDVVYAASYPPDSVGLVRAVHEVGFKPRVFGGAMVGLQITNIQMQLGPLMNGVLAFAAWEPVPTIEYPGVMHMLERYQVQAKGQGVDPLGYFLAPAAYAYVQVLGEAVEQAGTLDQKKLAEYLHTHTFSTVDGKFSFNKLGDPVDNRLLFVQYHGITGHGFDQFKNPASHMTIVAPAALSTGKLIYPFAKAVM
ncbi:MAG TPA: amino acid ABC transporter substrate-binding protein [Stellaceae bacterium]|nr:amino acid ABC transporter substrate-binding protein [Stellaceae bacterium]